MRYLKPKGMPIEVNGKQFKVLFTLDLIDELQDRTQLPMSELISMLVDDKYKEKATGIIIYYMTREIIKDNFENYSNLLFLTYIEQLKDKPYEGEKKAEPQEEFEPINVERYFYIATVLLGKSDERAWQMTLGEISTLYKEHGFENQWIKEDKVVDIMDI